VSSYHTTVLVLLALILTPLFVVFFKYPPSSLCSGSSSFGVNNNGGIPLLAFSVWFVFCAVFFVFTPVSTVQRIGIHLFLIGAAGAYTVLSGEQNSLKFFIVFSALTLICMIGSAAFFGYFDIWSRISPADCYAVGNDRCTKGYLTWIRIIAAFDMYLLLFAIVIALSGYKA